MYDEYDLRWIAKPPRNLDTQPVAWTITRKRIKGLGQRLCDYTTQNAIELYAERFGDMPDLDEPIPAERLLYVAEVSEVTFLMWQLAQTARTSTVASELAALNHAMLIASDDEASNIYRTFCRTGELPDPTE